jgi:hypothetical protein
MVRWCSSCGELSGQELGSDRCDQKRDSAIREPERGHVSKTGVERGHWVCSIEVQAVQVSKAEEKAARALNPTNQKIKVNSDIQQPGFAGGHPPNY